jgi:multiple sugar transport system permease protein
MARDRRRPSYSFNRMTRGELVARYALLLLVLVITVGPFAWQLSTSLKGITENIYTGTPTFIPEHPTLDNYRRVNDTIPVMHYAWNSIVVAFLTVGGNIVGATLAGYALARLRWRGSRLVLGLILVTMLLPGEATIVAQFLTIRSLGLSNTLLGVALPGMVGMINVLLMRTAFLAVPEELDQAARIDGANTFQRLVHVALPGVKGMLSVISIFAFIGAWDDFLWPLIVLTDPDKLTLTVGLNYLHGAFSTNPRVIAAGTMISFLPIVVVFVALQRFVLRGVEEGAIKG